jgi:exopolysaccharide production protein ExoQ
MTRLSKIVFCLYVIFMLVGASGPFQDYDSADRADSNTINQVVDSVLPLVALICLLPKRRAAVSLLRQEKYLVIFMGWCVLTVLWSGFPLKSATACIRLIGSAIVVLSFLLNTESSSEALKYVRGILALYIPISLLAVVFVPGAIQTDSDAWRGLAPHKNTLGEISLFSSILWAAAIPAASGIIKKASAWLLLGGSLLLLWGSHSATSLVTLLGVTAVTLCIFLSRKLLPMALAPTVACCAMGVLMLWIFDPGAMIGSLGRDTTFTGRTDIWAAMIDEIREHPVAGFGFGAFWIDDNPSVQSLYDDPALSWRPESGHEGYLDLLNETGAVGLALLVLMVLTYFRYAARQATTNLWPWLVAAILLVNFTESALFRSGSFAAWLFVLSYLATRTAKSPSAATA